MRNVTIVGALAVGTVLLWWSGRRELGKVETPQGEPRGTVEMKPGFTILELLVTIALITIVLALTVPKLGVIKRMARDATSLSNLRQHVTVVAAYQSDYRGMAPFITDPQASYSIVRNRLHGLTLTHVEYFAASIVWHVGISDQYYEGNFAHRSFWPPSGVSESDGLMPAPLPYLYSCTFFTRPEYWDPRTRTGRMQWGPTYGHEVLFPASKAIFGSPDSDETTGASARELLGFFDGSARSISAALVQAGYSSGDGTDPFNQIVHRNRVPDWAHTIAGVRGRDVP